MILRPPRSTRTYTLSPYTTRVRSNRRLLTEPPSRCWLAEFRATGFLSGLSWFAVRFLSLTHFALDVSKGNLPGIRLQPILTLITPNLLASDDRNGVGLGKRVAVRVDLAGSRSIKKKLTDEKRSHT